ncbi:helix-turn-helix transcriptional regulator [Elizabethkingia miricola]|uniref:helix-turn-helix transcriptional regulator n=1 Tax=Elizabethkingia miricola TaxID=172045 RepID=UPI000B34BE8E|nr:metalloregulator ArsR/SmtB family transcription factor [Elizabethkingia miricola]NHQ66565.1 transcriptional regulator [Elizabethkingia miricola]NHQ70113.1 transcriptional regulator [Elizabethkingia miricola]NHQ78005.1 transcriptional regulator [Elizabethkingia miricola]PSL89300.1 transcriptional regulator [Elizabethkingia miricola]QHQ85384.1 transcriptional regulator [Elizabethkingia miricola]
MKKNPTDKILMLLKMRGEATALVIAEELAITKEGARKHLLNLSADGFIEATVQSGGVGRPSVSYSLTEKGMARFPDSHADITVQLLKSVKSLLGENALNLLIGDREAIVYQKYNKALTGAETLDQKLKILSQKRSEEGYMAEWKKDDDTYYLTENHCPICAAATECQGFCRSELNNFRQLLGPEYSIERTEYILDSGKRCTYKIEKI